MSIHLALPPDAVEWIVTEVTARVVAALAEQPAESSPYLSVAEAADLMRASRSRIYDLLSQRRLTKYRDGTRVLLSREDIHRYLAGDA